MNSEGTDFYRQHTRLFQIPKTDDIRSLSEVMESSFFLEVRGIAKCAWPLPCCTKEPWGCRELCRVQGCLQSMGSPGQPALLGHALSL